MKDKELNSFLASVRRTRFVDYLDPLGETAQNAFERRLSWARVSQHDPAYADEARFLLDHAEELREVLRRELEEDDWVEEADVGREWESRAQPAARSSRLRENDRITEIFQADDMDVSSAPQKQQSRPGKPAAGGSRGGPRTEAQRPQPPKVSRAALAEESDETRVDHTAAQARARASLAPTNRSRDGSREGPGRLEGRESLRTDEPPIKRGSTPPPVQRAPVSRPPESRKTPAAKEPPRGPASRAPSLPPGRNEAYGRTAEPSGPASRTTGGGAPSRTGGGGPPPRSAPSIPPIRPGAGSATAPARAPAQAAAKAPSPARPGAPGRPKGRGETAERADFAPRLAESPRRDRLRAMPEDDETSHMGAGAGEVELEDWDAPDEPSTGIMRLEDVTAPPMKAVNPHDDTVALPSSQVLLDAGATRPSLPTRMRRPGTTPLGGETQIRRPPASNSSGSRPVVEEAARPRRSWLRRVVVLLLLLLVVGGLGAGGVALVGGGAFAVNSEWLGDLWAQLYAPDTSPVVPKPAAPKPEPSQPQATGPGTPPVPTPPQPGTVQPGTVQPGTVQPGTVQPGTVQPGTVQPGTVQPPPPAPAQPQPAQPQPSKTKAPPKPNPTAKGPPEPAPANASTAPPTDVRGLWVGSTTNGMSFKLTVLGQDSVEGGFEGTVEIQLEDGTFDSLAVNGKVDGTGAMSFKGQGASFNAVVNGRRASGSYTLQSGAKANWTAVH